MLCLRYDQGTDYFAYRWIFGRCETYSNMLAVGHGEPLYLFVCYLFNQWGQSFEVFVGFLAFAEMVMLWHFIRRRSVNIAVSIMLLLPVMYMTYLLSALRQALAMSIFLCFGLDMIERREWVKYLITCFIAIMFHSVSIIYFVVPLVLRFKTMNIVWSIPFFMMFSTVILPRLGGVIPYSNETSIRLVAATERLLSFIVIWVVYCRTKGKTGDDWLVKLYCFGTALYFLFLPYSNVASRVAICFKALEIVIVPSLMWKHNRYRILFTMYFFMLPMVMFLHATAAEIENGQYSSSVNVINFPYVSVFNENEIHNYRKVREL